MSHDERTPLSRCDTSYGSSEDDHLAAACPTDRTQHQLIALLEQISQLTGQVVYETILPNGFEDASLQPLTEAGEQPGDLRAPAVTRHVVADEPS